MELLHSKNLQDYPELVDCQGSLNFIRRINTLIDIMNSKTRAAAIWIPREGNENSKIKVYNKLSMSRISPNFYLTFYV